MEMLFCFVGNTFRKSDVCVCWFVYVWERERERGERAGREKKEEEEEEGEEKEEEELGGEGGGQDLICQEDYRLSYQKLLVWSRVCSVQYDSHTENVVTIKCDESLFLKDDIYEDGGYVMLWAYKAADNILVLLLPGLYRMPGP